MRNELDCAEDGKTVLEKDRVRAEASKRRGAQKAGAAHTSARRWARRPRSRAISRCCAPRC